MYLFSLLIYFLLLFNADKLVINGNQVIVFQPLFLIGIVVFSMLVLIIHFLRYQRPAYYWAWALLFILS